jgi:hypothetical protein
VCTTFPGAVAESGGSNVHEDITRIDGGFGGLKGVFAKLGVDFLSIVVAGVFSYECLAFVRKQGALEDRIHILLLFCKEGLIGGDHRYVATVENLGKVLGSCLGDGSALPYVPLFVLFQAWKEGYVALDSTFEVGDGIA